MANRHRSIVCAALFASMLCLAGKASASAYEDIVTYDLSKNRSTPAAIDAEIRSASLSELRDIERQLLTALGNPRATNECKAYVCRALRRMGSSACVPELEKLLTDQKLSHMARFALQGLGTPEANEALRRALGKAPAKLKSGIAGTMGQRHDDASVRELSRLLSSSDESVVRSAIGALASIGGRDAERALGRVRDSDLRKMVADARMQCADRMVKEGMNSQAASIYRRILEDESPTMLRIAALRGVVLSEKEAAADMLLSLLNDKNVDMQRAARKFVVEMPGEAATRAFADRLSTLPPKSQISLIDALTVRGDRVAAPAVTRLVTGGSSEVKLAAVTALAVMGDASSVRILAEAANAGGEVAEAAKGSLTRIKGDGVGQAMADLLDAGDPRLKSVIIEVLAKRADKTSAPAMVKAAEDSDSAIRSAAIGGLAVVGGLEELPAMVRLIGRATDSSELSGLEKAITASALRVSDVAARAAPVVEGMSTARGAAKIKLIGILGKLGGAQSLSAVSGARKGYDKDVVNAAVRALAGWPDAAAADDLIDIIKTTREKVHRVLSFRGYIRMANMPGVRSGAETARMYKDALRLATDAMEKKSVLSGLSSSHSAEAISIVEGLLADRDVKGEAEFALVSVASNCRGSAPEDARSALQKVIQSTNNGGLRSKAEGIIKEMDKFRGYITTWLYSGPYTAGGSSLDAAQKPEKDDAGAKWAPITRGVSPPVINLLEAVSRGDNRSAYMKASVYSPTSQDITLEMGSDDGIKVWINGKVVHSNPAMRGVNVGEDKANARLDQGWNKVLVKITQGGGDWGFAFRVVKRGGGPLDGMKVSLDR